MVYIAKLSVGQHTYTTCEKFGIINMFNVSEINVYQDCIHLIENTAKAVIL